jgi:hypothetical protein
MIQPYSLSQKKNKNTAIFSIFPFKLFDFMREEFIAKAW